MRKKWIIGLTIGIALAILLITGVWLVLRHKSRASQALAESQSAPAYPTPKPEAPLFAVPVTRNISIRNYFAFMDSLVLRYDSLIPYALSEYVIARANPWLIDTLANSDYYNLMAQNRFVYDQKKLIALHAGDTLLLPDPATATLILRRMNATWLDVNIPAFELRIMEADSVLHRCPVRVGKNIDKYLDMAGHEVDLRTQTGEGTIIRVNRNPAFYDPVTGEKFKYTRRDDNRLTLMPQIPWLEPAFGNRRPGQLIHPTTNPRSLGKPASNGCIGTREGDAWRIYFAAPLGTRVVIRYDLMEIGPAGDTLRYEDIYKRKRRVKKPIALPPAPDTIKTDSIVVDTVKF